MKFSRMVSALSACMITGVIQLFGATAVYAQPPDMQGLEVAGYNVSLPSTINSAQAGAIQNGYRDWMSIISNFSQTPVDNARVSYMSGYDPSLFDSVSSFPFASTFTTLEPGQIEFAKLLPGETYIPITFTAGFDSSRAVSPELIPAGGGQQTVTVTFTPRDDRYVSSDEASISFNIFVYSDVPGVTVESTTVPANLDQGESVDTSVVPERVQWSLARPQQDKTYTFTAVLNVPNKGDAPRDFLPTARVDGQRHVSICSECLGSSVTVTDPSLDGAIPGSGAVTFSVDQTDRQWDAKYADMYNVMYEGTPAPGPQEVSIEVKPGSTQPAPINPSSNGLIPVAIFSSGDFDATTVDTSTVQLGPMGPMSASATQPSLTDVNGDGLVDLIVHFPTQDTGIVCGVGDVSLGGMTTYGDPFWSPAPIRVVNCK